MSLKKSVDLLINKRTVDIANIHLSNNKYSTEQLREFEKESYAKYYTSSIDFKKYVSFPSESITLDYVLIPKRFAFDSLDVHEGLSDHNALSFVIRLL